MSKEKVQTIEETFEELDKIIDSLSKEDTTLDKSLKEYEKGIGYLQVVETMLSQAENQIHILDEKGAEE